MDLSRAKQDSTECLSQPRHASSSTTGNAEPENHTRDNGVANRGSDLSPDRSPPAKNEMASVYLPIRHELESVESILQQELKSETPFVDQLLQHSWLLGGKRIRPVFLLLSGASSGPLTENHFQMAAALEMIHTATLVHDDVLDDAKTRRHLPTVNSSWGTKTSVLLGDFLFTHAFSIAARSGSAKAIEMLAHASNRVCEGEMRQNQWKGNFELSESDYIDMISEKTGELCGVGCEIGALLSDAPDSICQQYGAFGRNLGIAFQIIDDILDLVGEPSTVGKTLGTDLLNQKPTLPVIHCIQSCETAQRRTLLNLLSTRNVTPEAIMPSLAATESIEYARNVARNHAKSSIEFARSLDQNPFSIALQELARFVLQRAH